MLYKYHSLRIVIDFMKIRHNSCCNVHTKDIKQDGLNVKEDEMRKILIGVMAILAAMAMVSGPASALDIPIPNYSFESGDNSGFISDYTYYVYNPATDPDEAYPDPPGLFNEKYYTVTTAGQTASNYHVAWAPVTPYHGNSMMLVNGSPDGGDTVWSSSTAANSITAGTKYYFSALVTSVYPPPIGGPATEPALLTFSINGIDLTPAVQTDKTGIWNLYYREWTAQAGDTQANLVLKNATVIAGGNDFAIDKIQLTTYIPSIPEPTTLLLLGLGLVGLAGIRRKMES